MYGRRTPLVPVEGMLTAAQYRDEVLIPFVQPLRHELDNHFTLQDDNARPHRARIISDCLREAGIERMEWPPTSPDMNPIEHAWDQLKRAIWSRQNPTLTREELRVAAVEEWDNLDQQQLDSLIDSMPRRVRACYLSRGGVTRY